LGKEASGIVLAPLNPAFHFVKDFVILLEEGIGDRLDIERLIATSLYFHRRDAGCGCSRCS
jgi:hypothetical protein